VSTIVARGPGKFLIAIDLPKDANGKRKRRWITFRGGKKDAKAEAARLETEAAGGGLVAPARLTVAEFLDHWLKAIKPNISPKTYERYAEIVRNNIVPLLGSIRLQALTPLQVTNALADALERGRKDGGPLSRRSVHHLFTVLKGALQWAVDVAELLPKNPAAKVEPPKVGKVTVVTTYGTGDVAKLITLLRESPIFIPVFLSAKTGMRRGEAAALPWRNVDFDRAEIRIDASVEQLNNSIRIKSTKNEKIRSLVVDQDIIETLRAHKAAQAAILARLDLRQTPDTLVCAHPDGRIMHPRWISKTWARLVKDSGLPARGFHALRHANASTMLAAGIHPKVASERLGHSSIGITMDLYSHVLPSVQSRRRPIGSARRSGLRPRPRRRKRRSDPVYA
jgi:integrase